MSKNDKKQSSIMEIAMMESYVYRKLDFRLFNMIKKDLPKSYLITCSDINLLIMLWRCVVVDIYDDNKTKLETIKEIVSHLSELLESVARDRLLEIHCDPFELFIDAWWIDPNLTILVK